MTQNIISRGYLIIGISLFLTTLNSCRGSIDEIKTVSYVYQNDTGQDLFLEVYNINDVMFQSFEILNGESVETNTTTEEVPTVFYFESSTSSIGDSVILRFSDNKCQKYYRRNINNGIMQDDKIFNITEYDNYSSNLVQQSAYTLYYTITSEDYNTSTDCI